jgi:hypothetical protein
MMNNSPLPPAFFLLKPDIRSSRVFSRRIFLFIAHRFFFIPIPTTAAMGGSHELGAVFISVWPPPPGVVEPSALR